MPGPIFNIDQIEFARTLLHGDRFDGKLAPVSTHLGAKKLAYNVTVVAPGKRAFPLHNHHTNEELFFIIAGQGTLRFGDQEHAVRPGDFVACPPGGPEVAHQLVNTGDEELRYLAVSTTLDTDVVQYPDSRKVGVVAGRLPGTPFQAAPFVGIYDESEQRDYWDGE